VDPAGSTAAGHGSTHNDPRTEPTMNAARAGSRGHIPGGLQFSENGYTFDVARQLPSGKATPVAFRILGHDANPLTSYDTAHDEDLHLIAVRRDLTGYQHVHPHLAANGTWSVPLDLTPGSWRLFADFDPAGNDAALVLGADVAVAGDYVPQPLPQPSTTAVAEGYEITLSGGLDPGKESKLTLSLSRDGQPVTDLQPYLGAHGHLVALRDGDLGYLHVHPSDEPADGGTAGPEITFYASAPSAGDYRLYFDFKHGGVVRTAELTVRAAGSGSAAPTTTQAPAALGEHNTVGHTHH
jgi:hypothetical protein